MKAAKLSRFLLFALITALPCIAAEGKPNFVVILTDDLGYGDLGVYGHPKIKTPRIDRMAAEGVRLTEFYAPAPTCTPSRAGLLTGRYPYRSGMVRVIVPKEKWGIPAAEITLAEALGDLGYATSCIGKWHLGGRKPFRPRKHGFDYFYGLFYSNDMALLPVVKWPRLELRHNGKAIESPAKVKTLTRRYTEQSVKYIEEHRDEPFFLYVAHTMPHVPLRPSKEFRRTSEYGAYGDVVEELDWSTGEILEALEKNGIDEQTMVVFSSDNGPHLAGGNNKRKTRGSAGPLRGMKGTTWEGGMRVPFIARWPGRLPQGEVRDGIASLMDLFTTFIELAGGEIPSDRKIDGKNIMAMLEGSEGSPHSELYYYYRKRLFAVRSGDWKMHLFKRRVRPSGKASDPVRCREPELYNLAEDPGEQNDVAEDHPDVVNRLWNMARRFHSSVDPTMNLPPAWRSVTMGLTTQAPNNPERVPE